MRNGLMAIIERHLEVIRDQKTTSNQNSGRKISARGPVTGPTLNGDRKIVMPSLEF